MNFCIAGYLRIKSWQNNAIWFIKLISLKKSYFQLSIGKRENRSFSLGIGAIVLFEVFTLADSQN